MLFYHRFFEKSTLDILKNRHFFFKFESDAVIGTFLVFFRQSYPDETVAFAGGACAEGKIFAGVHQVGTLNVVQNIEKFNAGHFFKHMQVQMMAFAGQVAEGEHVGIERHALCSEDGFGVGGDIAADLIENNSFRKKDQAVIFIRETAWSAVR